MVCIDSWSGAALWCRLAVEFLSLVLPPAAPELATEKFKLAQVATHHALCHDMLSDEPCRSLLSREFLCLADNLTPLLVCDLGRDCQRSEVAV